MTDCWHSCYSDGWQGEIVPEAFAHPAKVSRALIRRIYEHAMAEGWLRAGDTVADPFGGICGTGLDAMLRGVHWVGCELEPRFVGLAQENIDLWQRKYGAMPGFGSSRIVQGDSRKLCDVIGAAGIVVSSPPYAGNEKSDYLLSEDGKTRRRDVDRGYRQGHGCFRGSETYGQSDGQLGAMKEGEAPALIVSSPPYAGIAAGACGLNTQPGKDGQQSGRSADSASQQADSHYGEAEGQLSTMREGEAPACIISSPPYAGSAIEKNSTGVDRAKQYDTYRAAGGGASFEKFCATQERHSHHYGDEPAQIGAMPEGRFDAVVSSPPFNENRANQIHGQSKGVHSYDENEAKSRAKKDYIEQEHPDNLGKAVDATFWQAAREIVAQCALILKPGGHAIWITKDFVRKGKRVPFSDQWQALCEQQGFRLVCRHQAMLVAHHGEQDGLFDGPKQLTTQRKSFFRRLAESKGSPPIDWEDVLCMIKV